MPAPVSKAEICDGLLANKSVYEERPTREQMRRIAQDWIQRHDGLRMDANAMPTSSTARPHSRAIEGQGRT